jgi:hypothetical protein
MRLIDADVLMGKLTMSNIAHSQNSRELSLLNRNLKIVMDMPTAYDVEVVVAELIELYDEGTCPAKDEGEWECNRSKSCGECFNERMTEIVRNGGKE